MLALPSFTEVPDAPRITGISTSPYNIGDIITAVCRSRGTSPDTELVWYVDGRPVDTTYTVTSSGYVENEYRFTVSASATSRPECRLTFPPTGYTGSVFGSYTVRGKFKFLMSPTWGYEARCLGHVNSFLAV